MRKNNSVRLKIVSIFLLSLFLVGCGGIKSETVKINKQDTLMIAHRGLSGMEVENTAQAFIAAGQRSYYGIEADVKRTSDGRFIICHDDNLEKLAGKDLKVEELTLSELQEIPLINNGMTEGEVYLISLEEFIDICKEYESHAVVEFKSDFSDEEIIAIFDIIGEKDYLDSTTFISFNYNDLLVVRSISPHQSVQFLTSKLNESIIERLIEDKIDLSVNHKKLRKADIDIMHDAGLKVNCWTVNSKIRAEILCKMGVDFITSDILE